MNARMAHAAAVTFTASPHTRLTRFRAHSVPGCCRRYRYVDNEGIIEIDVIARVHHDRGQALIAGHGVPVNIPVRECAATKIYFGVAHATGIGRGLRANQTVAESVGDGAR